MPSLSETLRPPADLSPQHWESLWAPYSESTYQAVLTGLHPSDVVLDLGAGDLRLARRMAARVRQVYAIEQHAVLLARARNTPAPPIPENLIVLHGDARSLPFPQGITVGILLMRHCTHFSLYFDRLRSTGARRLMTNARWRMSLEVIDLQASRMPHNCLPWGWYACRCGGIGFQPGPPERITRQCFEDIHEVVDCPQCRQDSSSSVGLSSGTNPPAKLLSGE